MHLQRPPAPPVSPSSRHAPWRRDRRTALFKSESTAATFSTAARVISILDTTLGAAVL